MSLGEFHLIPQFLDEFFLRISRKLHSDKSLDREVGPYSLRAWSQWFRPQGGKASAPKLRVGV